MTIASELFVSCIRARWLSPVAVTEKVLVFNDLLLNHGKRRGPKRRAKASNCKQVSNLLRNSESMRPQAMSCNHELGSALKLNYRSTTLCRR